MDVQKAYVDMYLMQNEDPRTDLDIVWLNRVLEVSLRLRRLDFAWKHHVCVYIDAIVFVGYACSVFICNTFLRSIGLEVWAMILPSFLLIAFIFFGFFFVACIGFVYLFFAF